MTSPGTSRHRGKIVDLEKRKIYPGYIEVKDGKILSVREDHSITEEGYLCPGFIDAHVHIESSMLTPPEFARIAVIHGTVATVSDPHEIANVLGIEGVRYMQKLAAQTPCKIHFGIPSCVPATNFETAGATMGPDAIEELCADPSLVYLSEMMNFPGVIHRDPEVMKKIEIAKKHGKHIDGHAPGLRGEDLKSYVSAGIETDHEWKRSVSGKKSSSARDRRRKISGNSGPCSTSIPRGACSAATTSTPTNFSRDTSTTFAPAPWPRG